MMIVMPSSVRTAPTCNGNLATCSGDLSTCNGDFATCTDDLASCQSITIEICHNDEETLSVSAEEIATHTAHGDELGPCDDDDVSHDDS